MLRRMNMDVVASISLHGVHGDAFIFFGPGPRPQQQPAARQLRLRPIALTTLNEFDDSNAEQAGDHTGDNARKNCLGETAEDGPDGDRAGYGADIEEQTDERSFAFIKRLVFDVGDARRFIAVLDLDRAFRANLFARRRVFGEQANFRAVESVGEQIVNGGLQVVHRVEQAYDLAKFAALFKCDLVWFHVSSDSFGLSNRSRPSRAPAFFNPGI